MKEGNVLIIRLVRDHWKRMAMEEIKAAGAVLKDEPLRWSDMTIPASRLNRKDLARAALVEIDLSEAALTEAESMAEQDL